MCVCVCVSEEFICVFIHLITYLHDDLFSASTVRVQLRVLFMETEFEWDRRPLVPPPALTSVFFSVVYPLVYSLRYRSAYVRIYSA